MVMLKLLTFLSFIHFIPAQGTEEISQSKRFEQDCAITIINSCSDEKEFLSILPCVETRGKPETLEKRCQYTLAQTLKSFQEQVKSFNQKCSAHFKGCLFANLKGKDGLQAKASCISTKKSSLDQECLKSFTTLEFNFPNVVSTNIVNKKFEKSCKIDLPKFCPKEESFYGRRSCLVGIDPKTLSSDCSLFLKDLDHFFNEQLNHFKSACQSYLDACPETKEPGMKGLHAQRKCMNKQVATLNEKCKKEYLLFQESTDPKWK